MARRLYLGRLPPDVRSDEVGKIFDGYGRITDCRVMTGFGFVEFEDAKDAEDAVHNLNGKPFMGNNIVVEFAKESRPRREVFDNDRSYGTPRGRRPPGIRLIVSGVSRDTSWQDLKDFGRDAGNVSYADIDRDNPGQGILEYLTREDAERAVKDLDGRDLRGRPVRVALDETRGGPDNYYRERRDDRYARDDRHRNDRYRDDRPRDDRTSFRRDRSGSPGRRAEHDSHRPRSPPPRREVEERRPAGDEPDKRRDDRRRDEKDERYDDRTSRHANGEGSWTR